MMRTTHTQAGIRRAFTLIESITTMVVVSILAAFGSTVILNNTEGYFDASMTGQLHAELSVSLDRIVRELRKIELDVAATGVAPDIDSITASSIAWRDGGGDAYSLMLTGSNLMLVVNGGTANVLLTDVTAFSVSAYDEDNLAMSASLSGDACDPVRRIAISITLTRRGVIETLGTKVFIRSTMTGIGA